MNADAVSRRSLETPKPVVVRYWLRTIRGLEWVAAAEAASIVDPAQIILGHRSVFFASDRVLDPATFRCADDVFLFWAQLANLGRTRKTLARLSVAASALPPAPIDIGECRGLHVTASFLGERNYTRAEIEQALGEPLAARFGLTWYPQMPDTAGVLRVRIHFAGDRAVIGIGVGEAPAHRRFWRVHTRPGMLHPPVAASIAFLSDLREGLTVFDPFAGSGTILIEAGLRCPKLMLTGWDVNPEAIETAKDHAARARVAVDLQVRDAFAASAKPPKPDRVLSNPPWGVSVASAGSPGKNPLEVLIDLLSPEGRLVAVADQSMKIASFCERAGLRPDITFPIRVAGRIADVAVVSGKPCGLSHHLKPYWQAMENIPWEGAEKPETLEMPKEWGEAIRIP